MRPIFEEELRKLINQYSKENGSNTPDYIIARYLLSCLEAFDNAANDRDKHIRRSEMKRYHIAIQHTYSDTSLDITQDEKGEWVKAEDAGKLEQLNKEMLKVLTECHNHLASIDWGDRISGEDKLIEKIESIITKAEEV